MNEYLKFLYEYVYDHILSESVRILNLEFSDFYNFTKDPNTKKIIEVSQNIQKKVLESINELCLKLSNEIIDDLSKAGIINPQIFNEKAEIIEKIIDKKVQSINQEFLDLIGEE
ncbi:MAG: hypothetical protein ACTSRG_19575 [Candidatus Helarchaeota archaeon]